MLPWLIKGLNGLLVVASCYLIADVVTEIGGEAIEPPPVQNEAVRPDETAAVSSASPRAILDRNLFGAQLAGDANVATPLAPEAEDLEETKLPLRLLGTAASTDAKRSRAAIEDEKTRKHLVVAVGDEVEGHRRVRVRDIQRTRVVLDNAGRLEELLLADDAKRAAPRARPKRDTRQARRRPRRQQESLQDRLAQLNGADEQGISKLLSSARIVPEYDKASGEMLGMKVDQIKRNSLFEKAGLADGDVITEVNGIVMDRLEATSRVFDELASAGEIQIRAERNGQVQNLSVSPDIVEP